MHSHRSGKQQSRTNVNAFDEEITFLRQENHDLHEVLEQISADFDELVRFKEALEIELAKKGDREKLMLQKIKSDNVSKLKLKDKCSIVKAAFFKVKSN